MSSSEDGSDTSDTLHKIYTNDPLLFKSYINKKVTILTEDSRVHTGFVYTVDPVSESVVLIQPNEGQDKVGLKIIMSGAIKSLECSFDCEYLLPDMFVPRRVHFTDEEMMRRKESVLKALLDNRFPITEEKGNLCIEDTVKIEPPYGPENCICFNSIILDRIQTILSQVTY